MVNDGEDVSRRWNDGLARAAARAYEQAHGNPIHDEATAIRWRLGPRTALSVLVALVVVGLFAWVNTRPTGAVPLVAAPVAPAAPSPFGEAVVVVDVAGAVNAPAVLRLAAGSRVVDAIDAAGGLATDAQPESINLARVLVDGEQVYVPRAGDGDGTSSAININRADAAALDTLPGVGPVLAARIVEDRSSHGPFASVEDLERVEGIGPSLIAKIGTAATV